ncbi:MAG TPA: plastocyanin/azurin family copper-binding protein [Nitrosopumilus sp.]|nr:plastocyanin/azurin family copper-binding protein [Thermoproteota archaeon]HJJ22978.1 plastocyanin/azurin family copper-binding protein [Nitrosopumilus sp.]
MQLKILIPAIVFSVLIVSFSVNFVNAESVPDWVKNNALWYGQGIISEAEFLNAIKFLIEEGVIVLESGVISSENLNAEILIPNGNALSSNTAFYLPLNLEVPVGATVTWANEDLVAHNIQSQDEAGKVTDIFNSPPLDTGDRFEFTFEESGTYSYHCSWHPWRVGLVTVK